MFQLLPCLYIYYAEFAKILVVEQKLFLAEDHSLDSLKIYANIVLQVSLNRTYTNSPQNHLTFFSFPDSLIGD